MTSSSCLWYHVHTATLQGLVYEDNFVDDVVDDALIDGSVADIVDDIADDALLDDSVADVSLDCNVADIMDGIVKRVAQYWTCLAI